MDTINHRTVSVNGINVHIAEKGEGPIVLFIHGFPELWYTWRHQILALSSLGYHAVAPDLRGYGDSDAPDSISSYSIMHIVGDLVALVESLGVKEVFVVAHDWGALIAWGLCLFRAEIVKAFVCLSVPFRPRHPNRKPVETMRKVFGDDYYICRFQNPGEIEEEMAQVGAKEVLRGILTTRRQGPPIYPKKQAFRARPESSSPLPSWLSEEDLSYFASKYEQKGFTGPLNYYRSMDLNWELTAPWTGVQVKVPVKFIVGDVDMVYTTPGVKEYVNGGGFKKDVPFLQDVVIMEGVGHFLNQEKPEEINTHIYDFIRKF
ncbi:bifunctional epoxide hydrolase 2-like isoform X1 [Cucumis melo var. makuwa]|uniref:soluble epoxide hydrolase n=2 Tax=Cucumis melo TaxID=3656 RepID=A0A5D3CIS4_CUCMM|nr:bifunctional epoxide hydrolase 2-like isoform X1 [Cucumis melo var. makuwa]TYK10266.1 bifunctional epoxide hydrolase 2-like isoform X1 [Cucumis melo var. makuwa]